MLDREVNSLLGYEDKELEKIKDLIKVFITQFCRESTSWERIDDSQAYKLTDDESDEVYGYFKVGHRRANEALMLRQMASALGLQEFVPKCFPVVVGVSISSEDAASGEESGGEVSAEGETSLEENLWNGNIKVYVKDPNDRGLMLGIFEENIIGKRVITIESILLALALGIRDFKDENIAGNGIIIDAEEGFSLNSSNPDFILSDEMLDRNLTLEEVSSLKSIVQTWKIDEIVKMANELKVSFFDATIEGLKVSSKIVIDEGGFDVKISEIPEDEQKPKIDIKDEGKNALNAQQIGELITRVVNLQRAISSVEFNESKKIIDLINIAHTGYLALIQQIREDKVKYGSGRFSSAQILKSPVFQKMLRSSTTPGSGSATSGHVTPGIDVASPPVLSGAPIAHGLLAPLPSFRTPRKP